MLSSWMWTLRMSVLVWAVLLGRLLTSNSSMIQDYCWRNQVNLWTCTVSFLYPWIPPPPHPKVSRYIIMSLYNPSWIHVGLFLINVASRNKELRTETLRLISCTYPQLISIPIPEDINELIVGLPTGTSDSASLSATLEFDSVEVKSAVANLAAVISKNSGGKFEVESVLKEWTNLLSSSRLIHEHILSQ